MRLRHTLHITYQLQIRTRIHVQHQERITKPFFTYKWIPLYILKITQDVIYEAIKGSYPPYMRHLKRLYRRRIREQ